MSDAEIEQLKRDVDSRFEKGATRMDTLADLIDENRKAHAANAKALAENTKITKEIKETFDAVKGGFKVLGWIGVAVKWVGSIAGGVAAVFALYYTLINGGPPK
jgi:hypothetical protein